MATPPFNHLIDLPFAEILGWLQRVLAGQEGLPRAAPDESPEQVILRHEPSLSPHIRRDLRMATEGLLRAYIKMPSGTDAEVASLLSLARGLKLKEVSTDLHVLARDQARLAALSPAQRHLVVSTLFDLGDSYPAGFWTTLGQTFPAELGVVAFSGLLRDGGPALELLSALPDTQPIADWIYFILGEYRPPVEQVRTILPGLGPELGAAVSEWIQEQPPEWGRQARRERRRLSQALVQCSPPGKTFYHTPTPAPLLHP